MTHATYQPEERMRDYRLLTDESIRLARESQWDEAAEKNRELLALFPRDLSTLNRLGKALSELGRYSEAKRAYAEALEADPTNNIARKNLDRLAQLSDEEADARPAERIDPRLFIEETGKTGFTTLVDTAPREVLARLTAGDQVTLQREGSLLYVLNAAGQRIGRIEPRLANRLIKFLESGNRYAAGITDLTESEVKLIIREVFQSPSMFGRVSFPTRSGVEVVRGYIKDTMLRRDLDDEDEVGEDGEYVDSDDDESGDDDDDDAAEPEFEETEFTEQDR
ncbi:MAG TPA: tetratricopeptide repeat protein [Ktedonobacterales bacterium]|nr:tetratricopeptide repeat protein [Ktedonobacterales bacterium]